jgi:ABC-type bacteriocin/lantibiotic exporter with double-glycine peptidase domain
LRELAIPHVRQRLAYDCGPASLTAVLRFLGCPAELGEVTARCCTTPDGTTPGAIVKAAASYLVLAELREGLTVRHLHQYTAAGHAVIAMYQAWAPSPRDYSVSWVDGHYGVVTAVRPKGGLVFMDPSLEAKRGTLRTGEFRARWHDRDEGRDYLCAGIVFPARLEFQELGRTRAIK